MLDICGQLMTDEKIVAHLSMLERVVPKNERRATTGAERLCSQAAPSAIGRAEMPMSTGLAWKIW
jgi:hypothetical protein